MHRLPVLAVLIAALLAGASPAAARTADCGPRKARTLAAGAQARAYVRDGRVYACAHGRRRSRLLGDRLSECYSSSGCGGVDKVRVAGRFVAYGEVGYGGSYGDAYFTLTVRHAGSGGIRLRLEHGEAAVEQAYLKQVVLRSTGAVAWLWGHAPQGQPLRHEVWRGGTCSPAVVDPGPEVDARSLTLSGRVLRWRSAGTDRSAQLC